MLLWKLAKNWSIFYCDTITECVIQICLIACVSIYCPACVVSSIYVYWFLPFSISVWFFKSKNIVAWSLQTGNPYLHSFGIGFFHLVNYGVLLLRALLEHWPESLEPPSYAEDGDEHYNDVIGKWRMRAEYLH